MSPSQAVCSEICCGEIAPGHSKVPGCHYGSRENEGKSVSNVNETKKNVVTPTEKDMEVIRLMRQTDYGKVLVTVKNGEPVHAEIQKSIPIK